MIATDGNRQLTGVSKLFNFGCQMLTSSMNLTEILCLVAGCRDCARPFNWQVAQVFHFITESRDPSGKTSDANRTRPQIDPRHALPKAQRHSENADALARPRKVVAMLMCD